MHTAYIVCWFKIVNGMPIFKGAGTYSESANQLTRSFDSDIALMDLFKATGESYEDAIDNLYSNITLYSPLFDWVIPFLKEKGR